MDKSLLLRKKAMNSLNGNSEAILWLICMRILFVKVRFVEASFSKELVKLFEDLVNLDWFSFQLYALLVEQVAHKCFHFGIDSLVLELV